MKAAYIHRPGPAETILYGDLPEPVPGAGQVLVAVEAVAVNHIDIFVHSGAYPIALPDPFIIGRDLVGRVVARGPDCARYEVGDRVWANNQGYDGRQGSFAERLAIDEVWLSPVPEGLESSSVAAQLHSLLTVCAGLLNKAHPQTGESLFLRGAGEVGLTALRVAKALGCRVAITAGSEEKEAQARRAGADAVIRYREQPLDEALRRFAPEGVDIVWDLTPTPDLPLAVQHAARRGRLLLSSGLEHASTLPVGLFYTRNLTLHGFTVTGLTHPELMECALRINRLLPTLETDPPRILPMSEAAHAHRLVEEGQACGKIVLVPEGSSTSC